MFNVRILKTMLSIAGRQAQLLQCGATVSRSDLCMPRACRSNSGKLDDGRSAHWPMGIFIHAKSDVYHMLCSFILVVIVCTYKISNGDNNTPPQGLLKTHVSSKTYQCAQGSETEAVAPFGRPQALGAPRPPESTQCPMEP